MYQGIQVYHVVSKTEPYATSSEGEFVSVIAKCTAGISVCMKKSWYRGAAEEAVVSGQLLDVDEAGWSCKEVDLETDIEWKTTERVESFECHLVVS
jgi:hypothetical protein